jgi:hypothetical protein
MNTKTTNPINQSINQLNSPMVDDVESTTLSRPR